MVVFEKRENELACFGGGVETPFTLHYNTAKSNVLIVILYFFVLPCKTCIRLRCLKKLGMLA